MHVLDRSEKPFASSKVKRIFVWLEQVSEVETNKIDHDFDLGDDKTRWPSG